MLGSKRVQPPACACGRFGGGQKRVHFVIAFTRIWVGFGVRLGGGYAGGSGGETVWDFRESSRAGAARAGRKGDSS